VPDTDLLRAAIDVATDACRWPRVDGKGNRSAFGRLLGHSDGSRVRAWLREDRGLPPTERRVCRVIVDHPQVARWLAQVTD
jgi:hypothetical protein